MKKILFLAMITLLIFSCGTSGTSSTVKEEPAVEAAAAEPVEAAAEETAPARRAIPPFVAAEGVATLDGAISADEWGAAAKYPLLYNQLNTSDLRSTKDLADISGDWGVMFSGNMLYGYVTRMDDITYTAAPNVWENDCIELFIDIDGTFAQLRALVGETFADGAFPATAVWSADGSVVEYSVELTSELAGQIMGWAIALADNDGGDTRDYQLYPINGQNDSWQGVNMGSLAFGDDAEGEANIVVPFKANAGSVTVDGAYSDDEWAAAVKYSLGYNQLNPADETFNKDYADFQGDWGVVYDGSMLYGFVLRSDDITNTSAPNVWENDCVEVFIDFAGTFAQRRTVVGEGWDGGTYAADAVWSADGSVLEFSCDLGQDVAGQIIGFSLALADNDGTDTRETQLYPQLGVNDCWQGLNLAELEFVE